MHKSKTYIKTGHKITSYFSEMHPIIAKPSAKDELQHVYIKGNKKHQGIFILNRK
jgi:hypothetical protein